MKTKCYDNLDLDECFVKYDESFRPLPMKRLFKVTFENNGILDEMYLIARNREEVDEHLETALIQRYTHKNKADFGYEFDENGRIWDRDSIKNIEMLDMELNIMILGATLDERGRKGAWRNLGYLISC